MCLGAPPAPSPSWGVAMETRGAGPRRQRRVLSDTARGEVALQRWGEILTSTPKPDWLVPCRWGGALLRVAPSQHPTRCSPRARWCRPPGRCRSPCRSTRCVKVSAGAKGGRFKPSHLAQRCGCPSPLPPRPPLGRRGPGSQCALRR